MENVSSSINKSFWLSFIVSMHLFFITQSVEFQLVMLHISLWIPKMHNIWYKHFSSSSEWSDSLIKLTFCIKKLSSAFALRKFILLGMTTFILKYVCAYMHGSVPSNCITWLGISQCFHHNSLLLEIYHNAIKIHSTLKTRLLCFNVLYFIQKKKK